MKFVKVLIDHLDSTVRVIFVDQMVPGALLSTNGLRSPTTATVDAWPSASALDNVNSLANHITALHGALPYNLPALSDISEGNVLYVYLW